jgi:hypothetical protein
MAIQPRLAARRLDHFDFRQTKKPYLFHTSDRLSGPYTGTPLNPSFVLLCMHGGGIYQLP